MASSLGDVSSLSFSNLRTSTFDDESKFEQQLTTETSRQQQQHHHQLQSQKRPLVSSESAACTLKPPLAIPPPPPQVPPAVPPHPHRRPKLSAMSPRVTHLQSPPLTASDKKEIEEIISTIIDLKLDMKRNKNHDGAATTSAPNTPIINNNSKRNVATASTNVNRNNQEPTSANSNNNNNNNKNNNRTSKLNQDMLHDPYAKTQRFANTSPPPSLLRTIRHVSDSTTQTKITSDRFFTTSATTAAAEPSSSHSNNVVRCFSPQPGATTFSCRSSNESVDRETQTTGRMVKLQNSTPPQLNYNSDSGTTNINQNNPMGSTNINSNTSPVALPANVMEELSSRLSNQREKQQRLYNESGNAVNIAKNNSVAPPPPPPPMNKTNAASSSSSSSSSHVVSIFNKNSRTTNRHTESDSPNKTDEQQHTTLNGRIRSWLNNRLGSSSSWLLSPTHTAAHTDTHKSGQKKVVENAPPPPPPQQGSPAIEQGRASRRRDSSSSSRLAHGIANRLKSTSVGSLLFSNTGQSSSKCMPSPALSTRSAATAGAKQKSNTKTKVRSSSLASNPNAKKTYDAQSGGSSQSYANSKQQQLVRKNMLGGGSRHTPPPIPPPPASSLSAASSHKKVSILAAAPQSIFFEKKVLAYSTRIS